MAQEWHSNRQLRGSDTGRNAAEEYRKTNLRRSQVSCACHDFLCAVRLTLSVRPRDLQILKSLHSTLAGRLMSAVGGVQVAGRQTEREQREEGGREMETQPETVGETWRETISESFWHRCSKTAVKNQERASGEAKTVRTFRKLVKRERTWQRELRKHSGGVFPEMNLERRTAVKNEAEHTGWHWKARW